MKRFCFVLCVLLLCFFCAVCSAEGAYRSLQVGSRGDDVLRLTRQLYTLGYAKNAEGTDTFTDATAAQICAYQDACGLTQDGIATPALQAALFGTEEESSNGYRDFQEGCYGDDVLAAKKRLVLWGYFKAEASTQSYNSTMMSACAMFQAYMGTEQTGYLTAQEQEMLITMTIPLDTTLPGDKTAIDPAAVPVGPKEQPQLPALGDDHFLADKTAAAFTYANREDGLWYYISGDVSIEIRRYSTKKPLFQWFECEIYCTPDSLPYAMLGQGRNEPGYNQIGPFDITNQYNALFAISDDYFGYRYSNNLKQGIVIRNGEIKSEETREAGSSWFPNLDVLALFQDGGMKTYQSDEKTAQEYLEMGVVDTFAFGPILVQNGTVNEALYENTDRNKEKNPRIALGCVSPCHYVVLLGQGRTDDSNGCTFQWLAKRMVEMGCTEALNLDGGGSVFMFFMGDLINRNANVNPNNVRDISSMFGFSYPEE